MPAEPALQAFSAFVDRQPLDRRPNVYTQYVDIWNTPVGEWGADGDHRAQTIYALLAPWSVIPTIAQARLVVDAVKCFWVVNLHTNMRGIFNPTWKVGYRMNDTGRLAFDEPIRDNPPHDIHVALAGAKIARQKQYLWEGDHDLESITPLVVELLEQ